MVKRKPPNHSQNNFVAVKEEKRAGEEGTKIISNERKYHMAKKQAAKKAGKKKFDRFGKKLNEPSGEGDYASVFAEHPEVAGASSGNKFAPVIKDVRKVNLKSGKGFDFVFLLSISLGYFYLMFAHPKFIPIYYASTILPLFFFRFVSYWLLSRHHFCLEVCYFINYSLLVYIFVLPDQSMLFMSSYALSMSVGIGSTLLLNFKLVFSDAQTFINAYMHVTPATTAFAIRYLIKDDSPISFTVCKSGSDCDEMQTYAKSLMYLLYLPIGGYCAHMALYNFWVWIVPHPKLHRRRSYCNTFVKLMSGGFGDRWMNFVSLFGRKWALWTYSLCQVFWAALMLLAVSPLYYHELLSLIYLCLLLLQILLNGGSFYSYKLKKLVASEKKIKEYEGEDEDTEATFFDEGSDNYEKDDAAWIKKSERQRQISTVIRTIGKFEIDVTGSYGRAHRAKMSKLQQHGTAKVSHSISYDRNKTEGSGGRRYEEEKKDEECNVDVRRLAKERRMDSLSSSRPDIP